MDFSSLLSGIGVIVDDDVESQPAKIRKIISQLESRDIPYVTFGKIPSDTSIQNFTNVSFILFDWNLHNVGSEIAEDELQGLVAPEGLATHFVDENIQFLKKIREVCFCPIFIFSNEKVDIINSELRKNGLVKDERSDHIFVRSKSDISEEGSLFKVIDEWIKGNSVIYVLKEWEKEYFRAKNKLFFDYYNDSPNWPKIMWKTFKHDGVNQSRELGDLISHNIHTRMSPFEFNDEILENSITSEKEELISVLEGSRYIKKENLHENNISPGDLFCIDKKFYINIRASCDLIPRSSGSEGNFGEVELYLLRGSKLSHGNLKKIYREKHGVLEEQDAHFIAYPVFEGKAIDFKFKELFLKPWKDIESKRVGRLLPPFINKLQQKYSLYLQRQGLPRLPASIFS
ncbi:hypothetical protein [Leptospira weilii]|uniref:hypothetical protein n=1 Tax=Leptospira weilii TaxID=28184 RepID=UPI000774B158|nr:hypothetical protein [Leptospira weilii]